MSSWILFLLAGLLAACGGKPSTPTLTPTVGMIVWGGDHPSLQMDLIGTITTSPVELIEVRGVAVDQAGNLYVVDKGNSQVLKFDRTGKILLQWGSQGTGDGQFDMSGNGTGFVAVDSQGYIYVTDTYHVQKFDNQGKFLTRWGTEGTGDGQFMLALMLAIDPQDNIYVVDLDNNNVQKLDSNGKFLLSWGGVMEQARVNSCDPPQWLSICRGTCWWLKLGRAGCKSSTAAAGSWDRFFSGLLTIWLLVRSPWL